jgi:hypothetical protein
MTEKTIQIYFIGETILTANRFNLWQWKYTTFSITAKPRHYLGFSLTSLSTENTLPRKIFKFDQFIHENLDK